MGTWSVEFNNIPRAAANGGQDVGEFIRARVAAYATETPPAGEIFYFPPGDHVFSLEADEVFEIPEQVELRFAPGARLIPVGVRAWLVIRGALTAPIAPIFASAATVPASSLPGPLAQVIPFGAKIERLYPEWWGAGALMARVPDTLEPVERERIAEADSEALQSAFRAAVYGEAITSSTGAASRRVPVVELLGTYIVKRPIYLGRGSAGDVPSQSVFTAESSPLEVHGRLCDPEQVTLWCSPDFDVSGSASMLLVGDLPGLLVRCVSFELSERGASCVHAFVFVTSAQHPTRLPYTFQHCRFRSRGDVERRRAALVRLDVFGSSLEAAAPTVEFEGCVFEPSPTLGAAVRLSSLNRLSGTAFRGCTFAGHAMAMIDALGFSVTTTSCRFQNGAIPPRISMASGQLSDKVLTSMHEVAPEGGVDVYLRQNTVDLDPTSDAARLQSSVDAGGSSETLSACAFSSQDCRSTSPQFLVVPSRHGMDRPMRPATVIGLHHRFEFTPLTARPPAIYWNARWYSRAVALHLVGCRFDDVNAESAPRVMCPPSPWPSIFDYGIIAGDGPPVTLTDDIDGRSFGPGLLPQGLVVGCAPRESRRTT